MGAKDCLPPGVKVIRVSGWVAKLTFDRWSNVKFEQFSEIADVLFGLCEDSTPSKDHGRKN